VRLFAEPARAALELAASALGSAAFAIEGDGGAGAVLRQRAAELDEIVDAANGLATLAVWIRSPQVALPARPARRSRLDARLGSAG
jgi:hypothetical protein